MTYGKQEKMNCLACRRPIAGSPYDSVVDEGDVLREYYRCAHCGHLQLYPIPDSDELAPYYSDNYYGQGERKFPAYIEKWIDRFRNGRARRIATECDPEQKRALDIGCGNGRFLQGMAEYGFSIYGVELPGNSAKRASKIGQLNLHIGTLETADFEENSFGAITLWHVLEHFSAPLDTLRRCHTLLAPSGRIFIEVPNGDSWQARCFGPEWFHRDPPRHVSQYCRKSLLVSLEKAGFKNIEISTASRDMGVFGFLQSCSNKFLSDRNTLYDMLRSVPAGETPPWKRLKALFPAFLLLPPSAMLSGLERLSGHGSVLCVKARK